MAAVAKGVAGIPSLILVGDLNGAFFKSRGEKAIIMNLF
jgi:hypothetical protein